MTRTVLTFDDSFYLLNSMHRNGKVEIKSETSWKMSIDSRCVSLPSKCACVKIHSTPKTAESSVWRHFQKKKSRQMPWTEQTDGSGKILDRFSVNLDGLDGLEFGRNVTKMSVLWGRDQNFRKIKVKGYGPTAEPRMKPFICQCVLLEP